MRFHNTPNYQSGNNHRIPHSKLFIDSTLRKQLRLKKSSVAVAMEASAQCAAATTRTGRPESKETYFIKTNKCKSVGGIKYCHFDCKQFFDQQYKISNQAIIKDMRKLLLVIKSGFSSQKSTRSNLDVLYSQSKNAQTPFFTLQSHHIEIIEDPLDFFVELQSHAKNATYRIGLSSLYLGTGTLERFLMKSIVKRVKNVPSLEAYMLFDYNRSLRFENGESSVQMMNYYMDSEIKDRVHIAFHRQSKSKNKILSEILGVHHQKMYIFDDTVIIGGANLSHNYFLNRRDRYIKFKESPEFSDYLFDYLRVFCENSYQLGESLTLPEYPNLPKHYKLWKFAHTPEKYQENFFDQQKEMDRIKKQEISEVNRTIADPKGNKSSKSKNQIISETLGSDVQEHKVIKEQEINEMRDKARSKLFSTIYEDDVGNEIIELQNAKESKQLLERGEKVYIFPFIQHPQLQETMEPIVFENVLQNSIESELEVKIASGYLNFTKNILKILEKSKQKTKLLCSAPQANSFYRGGTFKQYIPYFYRCFEGEILQKFPSKFKIMEYFDGKWSFHAKGVWVKQNENNYLTILGSSNFNRRSASRDTELQVYLYSTCPKFNKRLAHEWSNIEKDCKQIDLNQIKEDKEIKYNWVFKMLSRIFSPFL